jgi:tetratricopeptide (TPR) repeat protein
MKEHKFILSALISLMLCFSFSIEVVAQANIKVPTKVSGATKVKTRGQNPPRTTAHVYKPINKPQRLSKKEGQKVLDSYNIRDAVCYIEAYDADGTVFYHGDGFFISSDGVGITNFHILQGAETASIKTIDGKKYPISRIIDYDSQKDLVKFKVSGMSRNAYIKLSHLEPIQGERIVNFAMPKEYNRDNAVNTGFCLNLYSSVTGGKAFQLSMALDEYSSGSPILNSKGEVLGIATYGIYKDDDNNDKDFAISISEVEKLNRKRDVTVNEMQLDGNENTVIHSAIALGNGGQYYRAIQQLSKCINNDPSNHLAYYYRGVYNCRSELDYDGGLTDLEKANELEHYSDYNHIMHYAIFLKDVLIRQTENQKIFDSNLYSKTLNVISKAISLDETRGDAYQHYSHVLTLFNKKNMEILQQALAYADRSVELQPTTDNYTNRAEIEKRLKKFSDAETDLKYAMALDPDFYRSYFVYGDMLFFDNANYDEGLKMIDKALTLVPANRKKDAADVLGLLGTARASIALLRRDSSSADNIRIALQCFDEAYKLDPRLVYMQRKQELLDEIK